MNAAVALVHDVAVPAAAAPASRGPAFISLEEAARRSGRVVGHLARLCRSKWGTVGLARMETPPNGGKRVWRIREDAEPSLARVPLPEHLPLDPKTLSDRQQQTITTRRRILTEWESAMASRRPGDTIEAASKVFCELLGHVDGQQVSYRTLKRWRAAYRQDGAGGLLDERVTRRTEDAAARKDDPFFALVQRLYLDPRKLKLMFCHYIASEQAKREGFEPRNYKACQRFIKSLPPQLVIKMREGNKAFEDKCEPAIRRDFASIASNDIWCSDDHTFDVRVLVGHDAAGKPKYERPVVNAWEDLRSRKIVAWSVTAEAPNTDLVLRTFRAGAIEHGLPRAIMVDNGKTFDNRNVTGLTKHERRAVRLARRRGDESEPLARPDIDRTRVVGAFGMLQIEVQHVWAYHGQSKPIERQFRTVCERFAKLWETYTGNSPANRPENLAAQLAAGKAPTLEEFADAFGEWTKAYYNAAHAHHGDAMDGRTPDQVYAESFDGERRRVDELLLLFATMPRVGPVRVNKQGVTWKGMHFGAFDAEVQKRFGQQVMLGIDTADVAAGVLVLDLQGKPVCRARPNIRLGFNANAKDLSNAIAEKKKLRKTLAAYHAARPRMTLDTHDLVRSAAARQLPAPKRVASRQVEPDAPPVLKMAQTGLEDQMPALRQAMNRGSLGLSAAAAANDVPRLEDLSSVLDARDAEPDVHDDPFEQLSRVLGSEGEE